MANIIYSIILQALTQAPEMEGVGSASSLVNGYKSIAMSIAALGLVLAGIAVLKKLATRADNAKNAVVGWFVALLVLLSLFSLV